VAAAVLACVPVGARALGSRPARASGGWCRAQSTSSWRRTLSRHVVGLSRTTRLTPFALAHDRRSFFAAIYSADFSGVAEIDARTSAVRRIKAFPDAAEDQADGAFDGRRLVWAEYHSLTDPGDFTVWAWDSRSGQVTQIGAATRSSNGEFWESPFRAPDALSGIATWVQGIGPGGTTAVHVYDLRAGQGATIHRGHAQGAFLLARHRVAWPESPRPGRVTRMQVASTLTGKRIEVPRALRTLRGVSGLATDGHRIAYPNAPYRSVWWSPSLRRKPREILAARSPGHVDDSVRIGGRYVGFGIWPRGFVADTTARRYVQVSGHGGWTLLDDTTLLVVFGSTRKEVHPRLRVAFVPLAKLPPLPACAKK
jgi:hypothetical protein